RLDRPFDAPNQADLNQRLDKSSNNGPLSSSRANTGQNGRHRLMTSRRPGLTLAKNSPQYRELQQRLERYQQGNGAAADVEANRQFQEDRRLDPIAKSKEG